MKVGILSMHRVINYGSFLQAYALKQLLLHNGANKVTFIDIKQGRPLKGHKRKSFKIILEWFIQRTTEVLSGRMAYRTIHHKFRERVKECILNHLYLLEIDEEKNTKYDLAVIGSDEVFNCCQKTKWGYTLQLYGDIPEAERVVSYAGSFGHTEYESLVNLGIAKEIGDTIKTMEAVSVRDDNSYDIVKRLTGTEPYIHLDPVLIYGYQNYIEQNSQKEKDYIVVYAYAERVSNKIEINAICDFAKKHNKKLYSFTYYEWCDKTIIPSTPFEVLDWFKGADYIFTDTFHGTIFSVLTHRQFVTLVRESNKNKLINLLNTLGLSDRSISKIEDMSNTLQTPIDYSSVEIILSKQRMETTKYLRKVLHNF